MWNHLLKLSDHLPVLSLSKCTQHEDNIGRKPVLITSTSIENTAFSEFSDILNNIYKESFPFIKYKPNKNKNSNNPWFIGSVPTLPPLYLFSDLSSLCLNMYVQCTVYTHVFIYNSHSLIMSQPIKTTYSG